MASLKFLFLCVPYHEDWGRGNEQTFGKRCLWLLEEGRGGHPSTVTLSRLPDTGVPWDTTWVGIKCKKRCPPLAVTKYLSLGYS